jgi:hypothetical protein
LLAVRARPPIRTGSRRPAYHAASLPVLKVWSGTRVAGLVRLANQGMRNSTRHFRACPQTVLGSYVLGTLSSSATSPDSSRIRASPRRSSRRRRPLRITRTACYGCRLLAGRGGEIGRTCRTHARHQYTPSGRRLTSGVSALAGVRPHGVRQGDDLNCREL